MLTLIELKSEIEDIREDLQHEYSRDNQQELVERLESLRELALAHESLLGIS